jgi:hypothetical protein
VSETASTDDNPAIVEHIRADRLTAREKRPRPRDADAEAEATEKAMLIHLHSVDRNLLNAQ